MLASGRFPGAAPRSRFFRRFLGRREILGLARHFIEEPARYSFLRLAPLSPRKRERKRQKFASPRHADIAEAALFIDRGVVLGDDRALMRQNPLFHAN